VCGVVGGHPWELALADLRAQEEIWSEDSDTWVASPYAPFGRGRPVDGGYRFDGRWPFSSGTDHCQWVVIGGTIVGDDAESSQPPQIRHFILPRTDYTIDHDSWQVVGLKGTGSKDLIVDDAFVPEHRVIDPAGLANSSATGAAGRESPLYLMPHAYMFAGGIVAATVGIAIGALEAFTSRTAERVSQRLGKMSEDPYQLAALGEAAADVEASRVHLLHDAREMYRTVLAGGMPTVEERIQARRNQVRASRRAVAAVDMLFAHAGANSLRLEYPLQRYWRDSHAAMNHAANVAEPIYRGSSLLAFGQPVPSNIRY
jgi:alkylation response protein AidB-like acyl-CoA dehydrogenase